MGKKPDLVLLAHDVGQFGGQERALEMFVVEAAATGRQLHVVAFRASEVVRAHADVTLIPRLPGPFALRFLWLVFASTLVLCRFPKSYKVSCGALTLVPVDAVWMHMWHREHLVKTGWFCAWSGNILNFASQTISRGLAFLVELWSLHVVTPRLLVAVSTSQARALSSVYPGIRIVVLPNPVQVTKVGVTSTRQGKQLVFVGGSWGHKGLSVVAKAAAGAATARSTTVHLKVVGNGSASTIRRLSRLSGLQIEHVGWSNNVSAEIAGADLFAVASRHETFSMAGHEALAMGIPVVSTEVHGLSDAIRDSGLGAICDRSVASLQRSISSLLWDDAPSSVRREAAAKWIDKEYGEQAIQAARLQLLTCLESGPRRRPRVRHYV